MLDGGRNGRDRQTRAFMKNGTQIHTEPTDNRKSPHLTLPDDSRAKGHEYVRTSGFMAGKIFIRISSDF